jgi:AcrR family transcriptional regulator
MARTADPTAKIALLTAAEAVFAEKGVDASKVEDITRRAGLSKGAFYLHFTSKEEALKHICESFLAHCAGCFKPPAELLDLPDDAAGLLAFALDRDTTMFDVLWQNRATVQILQTCQGPHEYLLQAFERGVRKTSEDWIELWKARGFFRADVEPVLTSDLIFGAYNRLAMKLLESPRRPPFEDWLERAQALFVRGLGTPTLIAALEARERHLDQPTGQPPQRRRAK